MRKLDRLIVFSWGILLYTLTLAPTVLWFDEGHLQLRAVMGELGGSAGHHPLWVWIAHQFTKMPLGDIAGRVNFVSAVFGALTLLVFYEIFMVFNLNRRMSLAAVMAFSVSHTFWSYAVRAETYILTLFLMSIHVFLAVKWYNSGRFIFLLLLGFVTGLGLAAHLMVVLYMPALLWLVLLRRKCLSVNKVILFAFSFLLGASLLIALLWLDAKRMNLSLFAILYRAIFTFDGYSFSSSFFDLSLSMLPLDTLEWFAFLALQFIGLAGFAAVIGFSRCLKYKLIDTHLLVYLALLYLGVMVFSFSYRIGERYAFYLPSYLSVSVCIPIGLEWLWAKVVGRFPHIREGILYVALLVVLVTIPVVAYRFSPYIVAQGLSFRDSRHVPGPNGAYYFLWPPKNNYRDAHVFADSLLSALPANAILLADPILASPVTYLQKVESRRPDVVVRYCCWDIESVLSEFASRPIVIADDNPAIYPMDWLRSRYDLDVCGPSYRLAPIADFDSD